MIDYNSMSYDEGKTLLKQGAFDMQALKDWGNYAVDQGTALWHGAGQQAQKGVDWAGEQANKLMGNANIPKPPAVEGAGEGPSLWDNETLRNTAIGALGGGALGGLSSLWQEPEDRSPISRMLTGAVLGGAGGLGYSAAAPFFKDKGKVDPADAALANKGQDAINAAEEKAVGIPRDETPEGERPAPPKQMDVAQNWSNKATYKDPKTQMPTEGTDYVAGAGNLAYDATLGKPLQAIEDAREGRHVHKRDIAQPIAQVVSPFAISSLTKRLPAGSTMRQMWWGKDTPAGADQITQRDAIAERMKGENAAQHSAWNESTKAVDTKNKALVSATEANAAKLKKQLTDATYKYRQLNSMQAGVAPRDNDAIAAAYEKRQKLLTAVQKAYAKRVKARAAASVPHIAPTPLHSTAAIDAAKAKAMRPTLGKPSLTRRVGTRGAAFLAPWAINRAIDQWQGGGSIEEANYRNARETFERANPKAE